MRRLKKIEAVFFSVLQQNPDISQVNKAIASFQSSDWEALYAFVSGSEVFPAFYSQIVKLKLTGLPGQFMDRLRNIFFLNLERNILLEKELFDLSGYFDHNRVRMVSLKGPALARQVYGDLALRQSSCDLDLLVRPEDFSSAGKLLEQIGYVFFRGDKDQERGGNYKLRYSAQLSFLKSVPGFGNLMVELHSDLRGMFSYPPLAYFWDSLSTTEIEGHRILQPSDESLLVYLCFTAMSVAEFGGIRYLYDLYSLLVKSGDNLDWNGILRQLKGKRGESCLYFSLSLAGQLFGKCAPQSFVKEVKPGPIKDRVLRIWLNKDNLLYKKRDERHNLYYFNTFWQYFASSYLYAVSLGDCVRIVKDKIFLPLEMMKELYPDSPAKHPFGLYLHRVIKPFTRIFRSG